MLELRPKQSYAIPVLPTAVAPISTVPIILLKDILYQMKICKLHYKTIALVKYTTMFIQGYTNNLHHKL